MRDWPVLWGDRIGQIFWAMRDLAGAFVGGAVERTGTF